MSIRRIKEGMNFKKKREEKRRIVRQEKDRISGIKILSNPQLDNNKKFYFILTNAIINYLIVIGMIGSFVKPFEINSNMYIISLVGIFMSLYFAFLYYNIWIKVIGYLICVCGFIYGIINFHWRIRAGFSFVSNAIMQYLEDDMDLPIERRYETFGFKEEVVVTLCFVFLLFGFLLLFNMIISESKGMVTIFLITFPITQFGMYFDEGLDIFYFTMYAIGIMVLYFFRNSTHYHMEYKKRSGYLLNENKRKNKMIYDYVIDGKTTLGILIIVIAVVITSVFLISQIVDSDEFKMDAQYNELKDNTRDFTRKLALVGFSGMFDKSGQSPGGVNNSKLGQIDRIRYDFETDLILKTVQVREENEIYIKCFNGSIYDKSYWRTLSEYQDEVPAITNYGITVEDTYGLSKQLMDYYKITQSYKSIKITNVFANSKYNYIPYFTKDISNIIDKVTTDDEFIGKLDTGWVYTASYNTMPNFKSIKELQDSIKKAANQEKTNCYNIIEDENISKQKKQDAEAEIKTIEKEENYSKYVYDVYLQVPEYNVDAIQSFINEYDIDADSDSIIEDVIAVFQLDFEYTFMPGKVPKDKDFVNYFLDETQKGYCTYFATAATLIYRYMGIPARYAGGYKLSGNAFIDGEVVKDENIREWIISDDESLEVMKYTLTDSNAHAWVELYMDGLGWIPVEVTPYVDYEQEQEGEVENENTGLGGFLTNSVFNANNMNRVKNTTFSVIVILIAGGILFVISYLCVGQYVRRRRYNERKADKRYLNLKKSMLEARMIDDMEYSYEDNADILTNLQLIDSNTSWNIMKIIEKAKFSKNILTDEEINYLIQHTNAINKKIFEQLKFYSKIRYRLIKML